MGKSTLILLGVGVVVLGGLGFYLYKRNKNPNPSMADYGGQVPVYVPSGSFGGPPLTTANKIDRDFQDINSAVQSGTELAFTAKKTWEDIKGAFS